MVCRLNITLMDYEHEVKVRKAIRCPIEGIYSVSVRIFDGDKIKFACIELRAVVIPYVSENMCVRPIYDSPARVTSIIPQAGNGSLRPFNLICPMLPKSCFSSVSSAL